MELDLKGGVEGEVAVVVTAAPLHAVAAIVHVHVQGDQFLLGDSGGCGDGSRGRCRRRGRKKRRKCRGKKNTMLRKSRNIMLNKVVALVVDFDLDVIFRL